MGTSAAGAGSARPVKPLKIPFTATLVPITFRTRRVLARLRGVYRQMVDGTLSTRPQPGPAVARADALRHKRPEWETRRQ